MRHPALGTLAFVLTIPMTAIVIVPYVLSHWRLQPPLFPGARVLAVVLFAAALPVFVAFNLRFVREGEGTPAPIAPTRHLVVGGPFRWVRNPGYVAVLTLIATQGLFLGSLPIIVYAAILAVAFHLFVRFYEEPALRRQFGAEYEAYCREVPRWLPRLQRRAARA